MWSRKVVDDLKVKRLWWLEDYQRPFIRKHRQACSCWMCGNPRKYKLDSSKGLRERNLALLHRDEINEFICDSQELTDDHLYRDSPWCGL